jgi:hypothetical protein
MRIDIFTPVLVSTANKSFDTCMLNPGNMYGPSLCCGLVCTAMDWGKAVHRASEWLALMLNIIVVANMVVMVVVVVMVVLVGGGAGSGDDCGW